jgi:hypothetical protein
METEQQRAQHRQAAFEDDRRSEFVTHTMRSGEVVSYEVRPLTLKETDDCRRAAMRARKEHGKPLRGPSGETLLEVDDFAFGVRRIICATFVPGTEVRVFDVKDLETLLNQRLSPGSLLTKLTKALSNVSSVDVEEERGNS